MRKNMYIVAEQRPTFLTPDPCQLHVTYLNMLMCFVQAIGHLNPHFWKANTVRQL